MSLNMNEEVEKGGKGGKEETLLIVIAPNLSYLFQRVQDLWINSMFSHILIKYVILVYCRAKL